MAKKKEKLPQFISIFIAVAAVILFILMILLLRFQPIVISNFTIPELSTEGYIQVEPTVEVLEDKGVVNLTGGCYQITAYTETTQAQSIADGLAKIIRTRPNTHDLMKTVFDNLGIQVLMVKIVDMRNNTYIGRLILKQGNNILSIDSRPSDGIALAVRTNSPIYMKEDLMKMYGKNIC